MCDEDGLRWLTRGMVTVLCVGLAGCGLTTAPDGGGSGVHGSPPAAPGSTVSSGAGQVTVKVDKGHYAPSDTITVTITNGMAVTTILAYDHQTNCTIVTLERLANGAWQPEAMCKLMTPTRIVPVPPGAVALQLTSTAWPAGTYRVAFRYFTKPDGAATPGAAPGQSGAVYSATFAIN
jgi:hypothetical protein